MSRNAQRTGQSSLRRVTPGFKAVCQWDDTNLVGRRASQEEIGKYQDHLCHNSALAVTVPMAAEDCQKVRRQENRILTLGIT